MATSAPVPDQETPDEPAGGSVLGLVREYAEALIIAMIFLRFVNAFVVQTFYIPSGSMEDTLLIGDHLFVNRFIYGEATDWAAKLLPARPVERGDIVVFRSKEDPTVDVVKRCVALPGDTVLIRDKQLFLNGEPVADDGYTKRVSYKTFRDIPAYSPRQVRRDQFGPFVVPGGHYFLMGDNRDESHDSRFWGALPEHLITGRAVLIYWSFGGPMGTEGEPASGLTRAWNMARGFFTQSRWDRSFQVVR